MEPTSPLWLLFAIHGSTLEIEPTARRRKLHEAGGWKRTTNSHNIIPLRFYCTRQGHKNKWIYAKAMCAGEKINKSATTLTETKRIIPHFTTHCVIIAFCILIVLASMVWEEFPKDTTKHILDVLSSEREKTFLHRLEEEPRRRGKQTILLFIDYRVDTSSSHTHDTKARPKSSGKKRKQKRWFKWAKRF